MVSSHKLIHVIYSRMPRASFYVPLNPNHANVTQANEDAIEQGLNDTVLKRE